MKKVSSSIVVSVVLFAGLLFLQGRTAPRQFSLSNAEDTEKRLSRLEERVKMLEAEVSRLREGQKYFAVPGLPPGMKNAPPGWRKFDYYGQTIYLVPLDSPFPSERNK